MDADHPSTGVPIPRLNTGCARIAPALDQDVEHDAMLVDRAPEVVQHAVDPQEHLIKVPGVWVWVCPVSVDINEAFA